MLSRLTPSVLTKILTMLLGCTLAAPAWAESGVPLDLRGNLLDFYRPWNGQTWAVAESGYKSVCVYTVIDTLIYDCTTVSVAGGTRYAVHTVQQATGAPKSWVDGKALPTSRNSYERRNSSYFRGGFYNDTIASEGNYRFAVTSAAMMIGTDWMLTVSRAQSMYASPTYSVGAQVLVRNGDTAAALARSQQLANMIPADTARRILETVSANPDLILAGDRAQLQPVLALLPAPLGDQNPAIVQTPAVVAQQEQPKPTLPSAPVSPRPTIDPAKLAPRFALVIGNSAYNGTLAPLANPARDASLVANSLRNTGFQVEVLLDTTQRDMKAAIARFGQRMRGAGSAGTGLFYYAGHGAQSRGVNILIPVNAQVSTEADLDLDGVSADAVISQMADAGVGTSIVILDACRNLPLARGTRSADRGLARMDAPGGTYIAYSTAPGQTAADGVGANSPFATALVREITKPDEPIEILFRNVRSAVFQATGGKQTPWDSSSLFQSFVFTPTRP